MTDPAGEALARELGVPDLVGTLLWRRGLRHAPEAGRFLAPKLAHLRPPAGLPDIDKASLRLAEAVRNGERIAVCGDYDVDGMTGTSLLVRFFRLVGGDVTWWIPDRERDGYGLSVDMVTRMAEAGARVAVTVDNGIAALDAIRAANEAGIDVVVTDHHLPGPEHPPAYAIVNPQLLDEDAAPPGARALCGCALAFKLAWAVADRLRGRLGEDGGAHFKRFLSDAMGLVALATLSDMVPLLDENRVLVAAGLASLRASAHPGLQALLEVAKVGALPLTTEDVAFRIAPRLNAAGRLSRPELVVALLTEDDPARCQALARELDACNKERRRIEVGVVKDAVGEADALIDGGTRHSLVVWGQAWHVGVVGIVAARLVDRFAKPSVVIGLDGETGRGSCRTPPGVNLHDALAVCAPTLERFGGHARAAGLQIRTGAVGDFRDAFEAAVAAQVAAADRAPALEIDAITPVDLWNLDLVKALKRMEPFGPGNPEPCFLLEGVEVAGRPRLMGQGDAHLSFALKQRDGFIRVLAWRQAHLHEVVAAGRPLDLVVTPTLNRWRGTTTAELRLVEVLGSA